MVAPSSHWDSFCTASEAGDLSVGTIAVIKGQPVRLSGCTKTKSGKHGHPHVIMTGEDLLTGDQIEEVLSFNGHIWMLTKTEFSTGTALAVHLDDNTVELIEDEAFQRLRCSPSLIEKIEQALQEREVQVKVGTIPVVSGLRYESFTMGLDCGRGYDLETGSKKLVTCVLEII